MEKTVRELAYEAIGEAMVLELGREIYDPDNVLHVAEKLSGIPYSWIKWIMEEK